MPPEGTAVDVETRAPEWDPYAPEALASPPESWAGLRECCPVAWSERMGGFWAVSRYDDVVAIARASERFNNSDGPQFGTHRPPLEVDRPEHTFFRRVLQPYFTKARVGQLEPAVRGFVAEMLEPSLAAREGDLAPTLAYPLPARTLCLWLGLPDSEWSVLKGMSEELFQAEEGRGNDPATRARLNAELYAYSRRLVRQRIAGPLDPRIDLISGFLGQSDGTHAVTEEACVELIRLLLTAGHNSTTGGIGNSIMRVAGDREIQRRLRAEPALIPGAVEEFLRLETPVQSMPRWANDDVTLHGRTIRSGEAIMLHWAAANRDPGHFPEPDRCLIDRSPNDHVAFGRGIHRCIGIDLARLEIRITLEELLARTSWFEPAGEPVRTTYIRQGVSCLPLRLVPAKGARS
jgi:cytochrome P450